MMEIKNDIHQWAKNLVLFSLLLIFISGRAQNQQDQPGANYVSSDDSELTFGEKQRQALKKKSSNPAPDTADSPVMPDFIEAAKIATPGVVHIKSHLPEVPIEEEIPDILKEFFEDEEFHFQPFPQETVGSGVILSDDGYIVTNYHVIANAEKIELILYDNRVYEPEIIGTDPATDLALLKIDEKDLSFIEFGNSAEVEIGEWVLAVGNPFNLSSTVTAGIISAKARNIQILRHQAAIESFLQTDAAVNPGNSGGALVNLQGKLVGINTAIATPTGIYAGYAFAVPVGIVQKVVDDLLLYGVVQRGYLGISIRDMDAALADELDIDITRGAYVDSVLEGSAADKADIQPGDVIIAIDEEKVQSAPELQQIIAQNRPGDEISVTVNRNGHQKETEVILETREGTTDIIRKEEAGLAEEGSGLMDELGINLEELPLKLKKQMKLESGVIVSEIGEGKIKSFTNMRSGFIITKMNNKPVSSVEEFEDRLKTYKGGVLIEGVYQEFPGVFYYAFGIE